MEYQVNLTWAQARELARSGSLIRRVNWLDRWIFCTGGLWWLLLNDIARVVQATDFGRYEFLASDWTTTHPDQLVCYNPPPVTPEQPEIWNGCRQIAFAWATPMGFLWQYSNGGELSRTSSLHLDFGATGTARVLAAVILPNEATGSIGGSPLPAPEAVLDTVSHYHINPAIEFPGVSSLDIVFNIPEGAGGSGNASIQVCFYPGQTSQPEAGGPVRETLKFDEWPTVVNKTFLYGQRKLTNPLGVAARLTITGGVDDTFFYKTGAVWQMGTQGSVNISFVVAPGASVWIAVRNDYGGPVRYELIATWEI